MGHTVTNISTARGVIEHSVEKKPWQARRVYASDTVNDDHHECGDDNDWMDPDDFPSKFQCVVQESEDDYASAYMGLWQWRCISRPRLRINMLSAAVRWLE